MAKISLQNDARLWYNMNMKMQKKLMVQKLLVVALLLVAAPCIVAHGQSVYQQYVYDTQWIGRPNLDFIGQSQILAGMRSHVVATGSPLGQTTLGPYIRTKPWRGYVQGQLVSGEEIWAVMYAWYPGGDVTASPTPPGSAWVAAPTELGYLTYGRLELFDTYHDVVLR